MVIQVARSMSDSRMCVASSRFSVVVLPAQFNASLTRRQPLSSLARWIARVGVKLECSTSNNVILQRRSFVQSRDNCRPA